MVSIHSSKRKCKSQKWRLVECRYSMGFRFQKSKHFTSSRGFCHSAWSSKAGCWDRKAKHTQGCMRGRPQTHVEKQWCGCWTVQIHFFSSEHTCFLLHIKCFAPLHIVLAQRPHSLLYCPNLTTCANKPLTHSCACTGVISLFLHLQWMTTGSRELTEVLHVSSNDQSHV